MSSFPETVITTPFGDVRVWATSGEHVGISTKGNTNVEKQEGEADPYVVFNNVDYSFRADIHPEGHEYLKDVGRYSLHVYKGWAFDMHGMLGHRRNNYDNMTEAARKKAIKLVEFVIDWIPSDEAQALLRLGSVAAAQSRYSRAVAAHEAAEKAYKEAKKELHAAQKGIAE